MLGRFVHNQLIRDEFDADLIIGSALIDMYAKCGSAEDACKLFNRLPTRDLPSWNAVISSHTRRGDYAQAEICLKEMQKRDLMPDESTYSSILSACSRSGDAGAGHRYFKSMWEDHSIVPDPRHFTCLVDLLGRSGHLDDAESLLKSAPDLPEIHGWRALLSTCKAHGGLEIGKLCYLETTVSDPRCSSGHVLMSSMYADSSIRESASEMQTRQSRDRIINKRCSVKPGSK
jgi:pentatricopeptide repeat protein